MCVAAAIAGGAVASVGGSLISSSASQSAADTQAQSAQQASQAQLQAAEQSIAAQQQGQEAAQANTQPWINAGSAALGQLGNLLGIQIAPSGQYSAPATSATSGGMASGVGSSNTPSLVDTSGGIPAPNQQLYQSNPAYKWAWDQVSQMNQNRFGVGYQRNSDPANIAKEIQVAMNQQGTIGTLNPASTAGNGQFQPGTVYGGPTGGFAGSTGTNPLATLENTPGYQWSLQQGLQGVENSAASRGMQLSGATLKDLNNYAQGAAQQTYNTQVGDLMSLAGLGGSSAGTSANAALAGGQGIGSTLSNYGNAVGSNIIGAGNAAAAGQVGSANAINGGLTSVGQMATLGSLFGNHGAGIANLTPDPIGTMISLNGW